MKRILILGSSGAGKSTFAKRLHGRLGLPIIHLDQHFWKPGWERPINFEWEKAVEDLAKKDEWIMDGNYRKSLEKRLPFADTIILLDFSRWTCLWRILKRRITNNRQDYLEGCKERINFEFLIWILWKFPHNSRGLILKRLKEVENDKKVYILKSNKDIDNFINSAR
jgi:adenylate kinase family enzyme